MSKTIGQGFFQWPNLLIVIQQMPVVVILYFNATAAIIFASHIMIMLTPSLR